MATGLGLIITGAGLTAKGAGLTAIGLGLTMTGVGLLIATGAALTITGAGLTATAAEGLTTAPSPSPFPALAPKRADPPNPLTNPLAIAFLRSAPLNTATLCVGCWNWKRTGRLDSPGLQVTD